MSSKDRILQVFGTLSPKQQRAFLAALAKVHEEHPRRLPWKLWRVWYVDTRKAGGKDYMLMYARDPGEARDLSNSVRHTQLVVVAIEEIP